MSRCILFTCLLSFYCQHGNDLVNHTQELQYISKFIFMKYTYMHTSFKYYLVMYLPTLNTTHQSTEYVHNRQKKLLIHKLS